VLWLVYALPFIHIVPYLWFDFGGPIPDRMWGRSPNPYMIDQEIIELTAMLGAVGGIGIALGASVSQLSNRRLKRVLGIEREAQPTLTMAVSILWVLVAVVLFALVAPSKNILQEAYTQSSSILKDSGFNSAWLVGAALLIFVFADASLEINVAQEKRKLRTFFIALLFVVCYFQLFRGDRDTVPFIFGIAIVYYYWAPPK